MCKINALGMIAFVILAMLYTNCSAIELVHHTIVLACGLSSLDLIFKRGK